MRQRYLITSTHASPNLPLAEVACVNGFDHEVLGVAPGAIVAEYPPAWRGTRLVTLAGIFEVIRAACGSKPITVASGYRTPAYNALVKNAAPTSQHVQGRALDLRPPAGMSVADFHAVILALARQELGDIGGIGLYATFVHVDTRPRVGGRIAQWKG